MSRLNTTPETEASGELAEIYAAVRRSIGVVPNAYLTLGSNSPALLSQLVQLGRVLQTKSGLTRKELEAINLAVSDHSGCDYCVAAHTATGIAAGFSRAQTRELRSGAYPDDFRIDAVVQFASLLVQTNGTLPETALDEIHAAGFSDKQIVGIIGAGSAILFTNMLNRVNDTTLDFPKPD